MQRNYVYLLALTLVLCAAPYAAQAQDNQPQKKTGEAAGTAPVTYVYGKATPEALARVRRRIAEIGTQGTTRRVISPIYIIIPQGQAVPPLQAPSPTPALTPTPGTQFTQEDLDRMEDDLARQLDERFDELDARLNDRVDNRLGDRVDDRVDDHVDDRVDDRLDASPAPEAAPSVAQVEGALLEAGLFRTTAVLFEFDRSTLLPVSEKTLNVVGDVLVRHPEVHIEVAGHTDSAGPDDYNRRLSEARALAVRSYLLDRFALAPERIEARGYGETQPVASNATATGRMLNRRVEFQVLNPEIFGERF